MMRTRRGILINDGALVVVKRGPGMAPWHVVAMKCFLLPGNAVNLLDAVGAGDSFDAGFIHESFAARRSKTPEMENITGDLSVTRPGGQKRSATPLTKGLLDKTTL